MNASIQQSDWFKAGDAKVFYLNSWLWETGIAQEMGPAAFSLMIVIAHAVTTGKMDITRPNVPLLEYLSGDSRSTVHRGLKELRKLGLIPQTSQRSSQVSGYIYMIGFQGYVKIGISTNPAHRFKQLSGMLPTRPTLLAVAPTQNMASLEAFMHFEFGKYRVNGEWFRLPDAELECAIEMLSNLC